jgi:hypothetical protein
MISGLIIEQRKIMETKTINKHKDCKPTQKLKVYGLGCLYEIVKELDEKISKLEFKIKGGKKWKT